MHLFSWLHRSKLRGRYSSLQWFAVQEFSIVLNGRRITVSWYWKINLVKILSLHHIHRVCYCVPDFHGEKCEYQYDECQIGPRLDTNSLEYMTWMTFHPPIFIDARMVACVLMVLMTLHAHARMVFVACFVNARNYPMGSSIVTTEAQMKLRFELQRQKLHQSSQIYLRRFRAHNFWVQLPQNIQQKTYRLICLQFTPLQSLSQCQPCHLCTQLCQLASIVLRWPQQSKFSI